MFDGCLKCRQYYIYQRSAQNTQQPRQYETEMLALHSGPQFDVEWVRTSADIELQRQRDRTGVVGVIVTITPHHIIFDGSTGTDKYDTLLF